jgi:hypothetical protein
MDPVGNGGQGRTDSRSESGQRSCPKGEDRRRPIRVNRTIDTRIFSSSERPVRRGKAEDRERVFARATEPPRLTEPIPSPTRGRRPSRTVSSRNATAAAHRDRAGTEPSPASGVVPGLPRHVRYRPRLCGNAGSFSPECATFDFTTIETPRMQRTVARMTCSEAVWQADRSFHTASTRIRHDASVGGNRPRAGVVISHARGAALPSACVWTTASL